MLFLNVSSLWRRRKCPLPALHQLRHRFNWVVKSVHRKTGSGNPLNASTSKIHTTRRRSIYLRYGNFATWTKGIILTLTISCCRMLNSMCPKTRGLQFLLQLPATIGSGQRPRLGSGGGARWVGETFATRHVLWCLFWSGITTKDSIVSTYLFQAPRQFRPISWKITTLPRAMFRNWFFALLRSINLSFLTGQRTLVITKAGMVAAHTWILCE